VQVGAGVYYFGKRLSVLFNGGSVCAGFGRNCGGNCDGHGYTTYTEGAPRQPAEHQGGAESATVS
jgi:hypothetical protein